MKLITGESSMDVAVLWDGYPQNSKCISSNLVSIGILVNGANLVLSNELSDTNLLLLDEVVEE